MLPPIEMLAKKNRLPTRILFGLLLAMLFAGCMASGPRALLRGKKQIEEGDYTAAVESLRTAVTLLPGNAEAWDYLGVAYQKSQQPDSVANAANAYQRALALDRDLVEVHWNLGVLWLEQNKNEQAAAELTAFTQRRSNNTDGWLKLGTAQLRLREIVPAEASFGWVQSKLDPNNAEALNGLGLARLARSRPHDAMLFFTAAVQWHPGYAPALLNLAVTAQQYLHDDRAALQYYRSYLELTPRPENWEEVNAVANGLEQGMVVVASPPPPPANPTPVVVPTQTQAQPPSGPKTQPQPVENRRPPPVTVHAPQYRPPPVVRTNPTPAPSHPTPPPAAAPVVKPKPIVQTTPPPVAEVVVPPPQNVATDSPPPEVAAQDNQAPAKSSFWNKLKPTRWFAPAPVDQKYETAGVPPVVISPGPTTSDPGSAAAAPAALPRSPLGLPVSPASFPRYAYQNPARPAAGDHRGASGAFTHARVLEQAAQWVDAMQAYRTASELDPSWFEAQYNYGVLCYRLGDHRQALSAYETALAIQPDSVDARYNFALGLKAAGYVPDAINELKKVLANNPHEARAHLALANLYAQKMREPSRAREHYLKVLELDPDNAQAPDVRAWLSANPE